MEMLQGFWKQHLRPRAVVGYGVKIFLPSPPNYVTRSPGTRLTFGRSLHLPPLGLYPSTGVDQAIFGTKFRAQKHKRGTFIQTSSMIFVEHKIRSNNGVHAVLARVNTRGI